MRVRTYTCIVRVLPIQIVDCTPYLNIIYGLPSRYAIFNAFAHERENLKVCLP